MANSFYGNIINAPVKPQFYFDKVYGNKFALKKNEKTDGVYIGRYSLIEYESNPIVGLQDISGRSQAEVLQDPNIKINDFVYSRDELNITISIVENQSLIEFKRYTEINNKETQETINEQITRQNFRINYDIDKEYARRKGLNLKLFEGDDSTVWQKIYISPKFEENVDIPYNEKEVYVRVAELNAAIPKINLLIDAPTNPPEPPKIDDTSEALLYNIRVQPSWGFQVKQADKNEPSDESGLSIYYNKAGFEPNIETTSTNNLNSITITEKASGKPYASESQIDTKELSINLPSIGNTISEVWNVLYGKGNIQNNKIRENYEWWKNFSSDTLQPEQKKANFTFNAEDFKSLIGTIKILYQMLGNGIIELSNVKSDTLYDNPDYSLNQIYYLSDPAQGNHLPGCYYFAQKAEIAKALKTDTPVPEQFDAKVNRSKFPIGPYPSTDPWIRNQYNYVYKNNSKDPDIQQAFPKNAIINPNVDKARLVDIEIGYLAVHYVWKPISEFNDLNNSPFFNAILKLNQMTDFNNIASRDPDTLQGLLNLLRDILMQFDLTQLQPNQTVIVDANGHISTTPALASPEEYLRVDNNSNLVKGVEETKINPNTLSEQVFRNDRSTVEDYLKKLDTIIIPNEGKYKIQNVTIDCQNLSNNFIQNLPYSSLDSATQQKIESINTATQQSITKAIESLDMVNEITCNDTEVISSINQIDGKVTALKRPLDGLKDILPLLKNTEGQTILTQDYIPILNADKILYDQNNLTTVLEHLTPQKAAASGNPSIPTDLAENQLFIIYEDKANQGG